MKKAKTATTKQSYSEHFVYILSCTISSWFCLRWLERPKINGFFFFFFFFSEVAFYFFGLFDVCMKQCRPTVNWNFILLSCSLKKKRNNATEMLCGLQKPKMYTLKSSKDNVCQPLVKVKVKLLSHVPLFATPMDSSL